MRQELSDFIYDCKADIKRMGEADLYFDDQMNGVKYHMHENVSDYVYMKHTGKQITPITEEEFAQAAITDYVASIGPECYYTFDNNK